MDVGVSAGSELGVEDGWLADAPVAKICSPILDYHHALETRDTSLLASSICEIVYRVYCASSDRFSDWEPWPRLTRSQIIGNFGKAFEHPDYFYENHVQFTHIKLNGSDALVRVIESGRSWKNRQWEGVEVLWHAAPDDDAKWRIAGHIHHLNHE